MLSSGSCNKLSGSRTRGVRLTRGSVFQQRCARSKISGLLPDRRVTQSPRPLARQLLLPAQLSSALRRALSCPEGQLLRRLLRLPGICATRVAAVESAYELFHRTWPKQRSLALAVNNRHPHFVRERSAPTVCKNRAPSCILANMKEGMRVAVVQ